MNAAVTVSPGGGADAELRVRRESSNTVAVCARSGEREVVVAVPARDLYRAARAVSGLPSPTALRDNRGDRR